MIGLFVSSILLNISQIATSTYGWETYLLAFCENLLKIWVAYLIHFGGDSQSSPIETDGHHTQ